MHALEIGPAMDERLRPNLSSDRLRVSVGDFEAALLDLATAYAVFSATGYHWIAPLQQASR